MNLKFILGLALISATAHAADDNQTRLLLHESARLGDINSLKILISQGEVKYTRGGKDATPLHVASSLGYLESVKRLIEAGVDKDIKTPVTAVTPLHLACLEGRLEVVSYLTSQGADKDAKSANGYTPLHWASDEGHLEVVSYLISQGADKDAKAANGYTPLHEASFWGHLEVVNYLISQGADKEAKDTDGYTPLRLAAHYGCLEPVKCLIEEHNMPAGPMTMKAAAYGEVLAYLMHKSDNYNGQLKCAICLDSIVEHAQTTDCCFGATYCTQCIQQAAENKNACPTCREPGIIYNIIDVQEAMALYVPEVHVGTSTAGAI